MRHVLFVKRDAFEYESNAKGGQIGLNQHSLSVLYAKPCLRAGNF